jgi:UDP-glucose 4-epimerase
VIDLKGTTALVTGASGFVGEHLCRRLLVEGATVNAVQRGKSPHLPGEVRQWLGDVADIDRLREVWKQTEPDFVFHLAGWVSGSRDRSDVIPSFRAILQGSLNSLLVASEFECRRLVTAGSMEEPIPERDEAPGSPYAAAKGAATSYARMFHALFELPVVSLRIFMVYGPGQRDGSKLIPYVVNSFLAGESPRLGGGNRLVDWIYVSDVVDAFIAAARAPAATGAVLDVGSGTEVSIRGIVERIAEIMAPLAPPIFGARADRPLERRRTADVAHTGKVLGWRPNTGLDEGLLHTVNWHREHPTNLPS